VVQPRFLLENIFGPGGQKLNYKFRFFSKSQASASTWKRSMKIGHCTFLVIEPNGSPAAGMAVWGIYYQNNPFLACFSWNSAYKPSKLIHYCTFLYLNIAFSLIRSKYGEGGGHKGGKKIPGGHVPPSPQLAAAMRT